MTRLTASDPADQDRPRPTKTDPLRFERCPMKLRMRLYRWLADDRGDVPGWVLVTVMTAGLVTALWVVADDQLTSVLGRAIGSVTQP